MASYIPEQAYGLIPGTYGEYGVVPWPAHMRPRSAADNLSTAPDVDLTKKGEAYVAAALAEADGVVFVTVDKTDRQSISTTIERLINMLDDLAPDPDLEDDDSGEPWLSWPERGPQTCSAAGDDRELDDSDAEPSLGAAECHPVSWDSPCGRSGELRRDYSRSQSNWGAGGKDDREDDGDDLEPDHDGEYSIGWNNEGSQASLSATDWGEPSLGWPEQINQVSRTKMKDGWFAEDGEQECEDEGAQCDDEGAIEPDGIQWSNDPAVSQDSLEWRGAW